EVLTGEGHRTDLDHPLERTEPQRGRLDVVGQEEETAGAQNARHLGYGSSIVGHAAQCEGSDDGVEGSIVELQILGVAETQIGFAAEGGGPAASEGEHARTQFDPTELDVAGIVFEVEAGAHGDLQSAAAGAPGDPRPGVLEESALSPRHRAVVVVGMPVPPVPKIIDCPNSGHTRAPSSSRDSGSVPESNASRRPGGMRLLIDASLCILWEPSLKL